jgi:cell division protein FtsI (penicillin-binding protein 3)
MGVESVPAITTENDAGLLPNFRGLTMRQVIREGKNLGIRVMVEGTGLAVAQIPEAGSPLERVSSVRVNFMPSM